MIAGRRRQGKTFLLQALCQQAGGFYFSALEATEAESLRSIGAAVGAHRGSAVPVRPADWGEAIDALLDLGRDAPTAVVIDEFPYLARSSPSLPSVIQAAFAPRREQRRRSQVRLLLCGSAMSFMGRLLAGSAPLRGRAGLELVVHPFDHERTAEFWVGGTPAYRREFVRNDVPNGPDDFDDWVVRTVLNPQSPLFREARYLLAEETAVRDPSLYHSVLAAVAEGNVTRGGIANYLGRKAPDITHPLTVLEDSGLLARDADVFRDNRSTYRIAEPLITFYHAVMRPVWAQLERPGAAGRVWKSSKRRFDSNVLGPRFERICRAWTLHDAPGDLFGGATVANVGRGIVYDARERTTHEIDVAVVGVEGRGRPPLLAFGEVKWNEVMGLDHLRRLRHALSLIEAGARYDTSETKLLCFSGAGFSPALLEASTAGDVILVSAADLFRSTRSP